MQLASNDFKPWSKMHNVFMPSGHLLFGSVRLVDAVACAGPHGTVLRDVGA